MNEWRFLNRGQGWTASVIPFLMLAWISIFASHQVNAEETVSGNVAGFLLGPEDLLEISVWNEEKLQREVMVRPDGKISFPLVGDIQAEGRTPEQLRYEIASWLKKYIPDPVVTVLVKKIESYKIYVLGQINKPGEYTVGGYLDVMQALAMAGGLNAFAAEDDIRILRRQEGTEKVIPFDYSRVKKGRDLAQNIVLQRGDVVVVP